MIKNKVFILMSIVHNKPGLQPNVDFDGYGLQQTWSTTKGSFGFGIIIHQFMIHNGIIVSFHLFDELSHHYSSIYDHGFTVSYHLFYQFGCHFASMYDCGITQITIAFKANHTNHDCVQG